MRVDLFLEDSPIPLMVSTFFKQLNCTKSDGI